MLTATDDIAAALDRAMKRWPEDADRPTRLLHRLIAAGDAAAESAEGTEHRSRLDAVAATSGIFSGLYPPGYLEDLRQEWPE